MISSLWQPSTLPRPRRRVLIYYICGNPGCIGFYADFFEALRGMLDSSETHTAYDIYGRNLKGFSDAEHEPFAPGSGSEPWDVEGQIDVVTADVLDRASREVYDFVILAGHSIGAYMAVEIFDRHLRNPERAPRLHLRHGFLLFPTIASMSISPNGCLMQRLRRIPTLESRGHVYVRLLLGLVPRSLVPWFMRTLMGFSPRAADVAAEWVMSRDGVHQMLHMGMWELDNVCEERWDDALWGPATGGDASLSGKNDDVSAEAQTPRFFFFYGKSDGWVPDHVRDEFVKRRMEHGKRGGRTSIVVDEGNLPHAFCTSERKSSSLPPWTVSLVS